jgi:hypothetical protein
VALDMGGEPHRQAAALAAALAVFGETHSSESAAEAAHRAAALWDAEARAAATGQQVPGGASTPAYRVQVGSAGESSWVDPASLVGQPGSPIATQVLERPDVAPDASMPSPSAAVGEVPPPPPFPAGVSTTKRGNTRWWLIGCGGGLLIAVLVLGIGGFAIANAVKSGSINIQGLAQDFPVYPGAKQTGVNTFVGTSGTDTRVSWEVNASVESVGAFYERELNSGNWEITSKNPATGDVLFRKRDQPAEQGQMRLLAAGQSTTIQVEIRKP